MPRNVQLQSLVDSLRGEIRDSSSVALGIDQNNSLMQILRRTQQNLYDAYDWPFLRIKPQMTLSAGQQFYDLPTSNGFILNLEKVEKADLFYSNVPQPLYRGIDSQEYAQYNSNIGIRADPALKWDVQSTGTGNAGLEQIEIWPIPASNGAIVQWIGFRALRPLIALDDVCDLDDRLIYMYAAAEILAARESKDATEKKSAADELFKLLKGRVKASSRQMVKLGGGTDGLERERSGVIIRIGATTN